MYCVLVIVLTVISEMGD